jgi:hypothetical protein
MDDDKFLNVEFNIASSATYNPLNTAWLWNLKTKNSKNVTNYI